jgi:hypothetical protein
VIEVGRASPKRTEAALRDIITTCEICSSRCSTIALQCQGDSEGGRPFQDAARRCRSGGGAELLSTLREYSQRFLVRTCQPVFPVGVSNLA